MKILSPISDFIEINASDFPSKVSYYYEGICPKTRKKVRLPRTNLAEKIAFALMKHLKNDPIFNYEGKMYGILVVETPLGELGVIKAFSGFLNGKSILADWVPPIPGRQVVALAENLTLTRLEEMKQEIISLENLPQRKEYEKLFSQKQQIWQEMKLRHNQRKQQRHQKREFFTNTLFGETLTTALENLEEESRLDGIERRNLKRKWNPILQPLSDVITKADKKITVLKQQRKELSRQLQLQMQTAYTLTNFAGNTFSLSELTSKAFIPTGTGDCCAPKLLHYAATHNLKPISLAEFWWGNSSADGNKVSGEFYGACVERCQPLMGFLLSGLEENYSTFVTQNKLKIVYEDDYLIVVNKPSGLLSVPGRTSDKFDSVESRLKYLVSGGLNFKAVHRLDKDTSGLFILAKNLHACVCIKKQFEERRVSKIYEAILAGNLTKTEGTIELPLWADPRDRPYQKVDWDKGKPSITKFKVINWEENGTRVEFMPITGRTHQIRVHAASKYGLGIPILGDRFYGHNDYKDNLNTRLYLHAREIKFQHPYFQTTIHLQIPTPF